MQFHKTLQPLVNSISKLQFSTKHKMTPSPSVNDGSTLDVVTRTSCNDKYTEDFNSNLENIVNSILSDTTELLQKLGTYYQKEVLEIVLHADRIQYHYFDGQQYKGSIETVEGFDLSNNEAYQLGALDYGKVEKRLEPKAEFYTIIVNQIERLKIGLSELLFDEKQEVQPVEKMKWNVKPSLLAAILEELEIKGWVNPPRTNSDTSLPKYAKLACGIFEFDGTERSLYNALKDSTLSDTKRVKIDLPQAEDLS